MKHVFFVDVAVAGLHTSVPRQIHHNVVEDPLSSGRRQTSTTPHMARLTPAVQGRRKAGAQSSGPTTCFQPEGLTPVETERWLAFGGQTGDGRPSCRRVGRSAVFVCQERDAADDEMEHTGFKLDRRGNAFIEYFILALVVLLATLAFYSGGTFNGVRVKVEDAFNGAMNEVLKE